MTTLAATPVPTPPPPPPTESKFEESVEINVPVLKGLASGAIITTGAVLLWVGVGFAAFIKSLICFGKKGKTGQKILGLILAVLFGPFYFLYKPPGYCA